MSTTCLKHADARVDEAASKEHLLGARTKALGSSAADMPNQDVRAYPEAHRWSSGALGRCARLGSG